MGSKLALIIGFGFIIMALCYAGDLIAIQVIHSQLDAISLTVSQHISYYGTLVQKTIDFVEKDGKTHIVSLSGPVQIGEVYEYRLYREYDPLFMGDEVMEISIRRSAVVGYY